jgi:hypothetical protein
MKTSLSLAALALFATSLVMPMQAEAADRQISVNRKKLQTFTVNTSADDTIVVADANPSDPQTTEPPKATGAEPDQNIEFSVKNDDQPAEFKVGNDEEAVVKVAEVTPDEPVAKIKPKAFRVQEKQAVVEDASNEDNSDTPQIKPNKTQEFRVSVQDEPEQAAPSQDGEDEVASSETERPASQFKDRVKPTKKLRPAPVESNDEEATTDDTDHSADIAADTSEEPAVEETEEPVAAPTVRHKYQTYYYHAKQAAYENTQDDYAEAEPVTYQYRHNYTPSYRQSYVQSYQPRYYARSSCHQNNSY